MKTLTKRQKEILDFLQNFIEKKQFSPSYKEIRDHFGFSSLASVHKFIKALAKKGFLYQEKQKRRSISLKQDSPPSEKEAISLPLIGQISLGFPIETYSNPQSFPVPIYLIREIEKSYILRVRGDSLLEEHMVDGDLIIIEASTEAESADTIVATINQQDTILKRYYDEGMYARLEGGNHKSLFVKQEHLVIHGIVTGLFRFYS